jgi:hypothetical protein
MVGRRLGWTGFALWVAIGAAGCGGQSRRHDDGGPGGTGDTGGAGSGGTAGSVPSAGAGGSKTGCTDLPLRYETALIEAKRCDPRSGVEQCTRTAGSTIRCGCPTYVNDDEVLLRLSQQFQADLCSGPVACGPCPDPPLRGVCGEDSFCADVYPEP